MNVVINLKFRDFLNVSWHSVTLIKCETKKGHFFTELFLKRLSPELYFTILFFTGWCVSIYTLLFSHNGFGRGYGYFFTFVMGCVTLKVMQWFIHVLQSWKYVQTKASLSLSDKCAEISINDSEHLILSASSVLWKESRFLYWCITEKGTAIIIPKRDLKKVDAEEIFRKWLMK